MWMFALFEAEWLHNVNFLFKLGLEEHVLHVHLMKCNPFTIMSENTILTIIIFSMREKVSLLSMLSVFEYPFAIQLSLEPVDNVSNCALP